ncbi:VOC family protein [Bacillus sp. RO3]|nr:VOC family protein [Bacillus sp. RO3]
MELTHTRLLVNDYKECFLFYRDVLGFEVSWGDETSSYGQFKVGHMELGIFDRKRMADALDQETFSEPRRTDRFALVLKVENVEETYEKLKGMVTFITLPMEKVDWGLKVAHFRDREGTLIEIYENL